MTQSTFVLDYLPSSDLPVGLSKWRLGRTDNEMFTLPISCLELTFLFWEAVGYDKDMRRRLLILEHRSETESGICYMLYLPTKTAKNVRDRFLELVEKKMS